LALETIVCKLGKLEARVLLTGVITETLGHPHKAVRHTALKALLNNALDQNSLGQHTDTISRFILDAGVQGGDGWACFLGLGVMCKLEPAALSEF